MPGGMLFGLKSRPRLPREDDDVSDSTTTSLPVPAVTVMLPEMSRALIVAGRAGSERGTLTFSWAAAIAAHKNTKLIARVVIAVFTHIPQAEARFTLFPF
jgi:hypothetical protein